MATIGTLGDIVFTVSSNTVRTFENMKWDSSAQYAKHERHLQDVLLEFTGTDPDEITFSMYLSAYLGVNPMTELVKLLTAERSGTAMRLVIGEKAYGKYRWVITGTKKELEDFDNRGNLLSASVRVSLMAYGAR